MKKNKVVAIIIVVIVAILCIVKGVGSSGDSKTDATTSKDDKTSAVTSSSTDDKKKTTIQEQVLMDANDVKITATDYTTDSVLGDGIQLLIENNSDQDYDISTDAVIVNNYMITDLFASSISAGNKSKETLYLSSDQLEAAGIDNIGQIEIYFTLMDSSTYEVTYRSEVCTIQTSDYDKMDTTPADDGQEIYNSDGIRIVAKYVDEDSFWGNAVVLYLENSTDKKVTITADDLAVNGYMMSPFFSSTIYPGKMAVSDITLLQSDLDTNGIKSVDDVEVSFDISDADSYQSIANTGKISFSTK